MSSYLRLVILLAMMAFLLVACGGETSQPAPTAPPAAADTVPSPAVAPTAEPELPSVPPPSEELLHLRSGEWQWIAYAGPMQEFSIEAPGNYRVTFNDDATFTAVADCNNLAGNYVASDSGEITITPGPMTLAACSEGSRSDQFVALLGSATRYYSDGDNLILELMADGGTMELTPADNTATIIAGEGDLAGGQTVPGVEMLDDCFVEPPEDFPYEVDCGYVIVPEFHAQENGNTLKLGFMRLNSGLGTAVSPLFMLGGGPGQSLISEDEFALFQPGVLGGVLGARDVVILDQRGTKHTSTYLDCPAYNRLPWTRVEQGLTEEEATVLKRQSLQTCIDDFKAQGVNFDAYNSVENAADVNAARQALGYNRIFYYGASYGSQLGQHVMRDFPEMLEGVILDGANALSRKSWIEDRALDAQWGIDNLTALCQADEACREAYDIPALLDSVFALLPDEPLTFPYTDPSDPSITFDVPVSKAGLATFIYGKQGAVLTTVALPATLSLLSTSGTAGVVEILGTERGSQIAASRDTTEGALAILMHFAMVCSDDPVHSLDDIVIEDGLGEYARLFAETAGADYVTACEVLGVQELPDATDENVTVDVPTLLLAGDLDVATPTFRTQVVADALPNRTFLIFPGHTHVQVNGSNFCAAEIMTDFVLDPTAPLDTSCTEEPSPYRIMLPEDLQGGDDSGD